MCGISGELNLGFGHLSILRSLSHRGPDNHGEYQDSYINLIHDRLSVVDLSDSNNQPFIDHQIVLLFNGEIYNYTELRNKYISLGYVFKTQGDTEVLLAGYLLMGLSSFSLLDGMFAIALYDIENREIHLVRDNNGVKPLYYYTANGNFAFSSEIKGFTDTVTSNRNYKSGILFNVFGFVPEPETFVKNVFGVLPGPVMTYSLGEFKFSKTIFFSVRRNIHLCNESLKDLLNETLIPIYANEVKSAIALSGGLDSTIIAFLLNELGIKDLNSISLISSGLLFSEEHNQRKISDFLSLRAIFSDTSVHNFKEQWRSAMDSPTIDGYNVFYLSKIAKENNFKVVYSGLGADELFFGYSKYKLLSKLMTLSNFNIKYLAPLNDRFNYIVDKNLINLYVVLRSVNSPRVVANNLNCDYAEVVNTVSDYTSKHYNSKFDNNLFSFTELDLNFYTRNQLLKDGDVFSMSNSIEMRFPFLSRRIVDYSFSASIHKIQNVNSNKNLLRNILPPSVKSLLAREKMGFHIDGGNILTDRALLFAELNSKYFI